MNTDSLQEQKVSAAFSQQSAVFDDIYDHNAITLYMRNRGRAEAFNYLRPGDKILELNCGTGIDTVFFAKKGFKIVATDNAEGMVAQTTNKIMTADLDGRASCLRCSFNDLSALGGEKFDYLFSNFSGLNCAPDLGSVLNEADSVLKPGGYFTFVVMPKICPWELIMLLRGRTKLALRRLGKAPARAHIEGVLFDCYYYNPSYVTRHLKGRYTLCALTGLASIVPPPSLDYFPVKYPRLLKTLMKWEDRICSIFPFNRWCDQYVITMRKDE